LRNARRLSLRRETLAPLTTDEMVAVAGGSHLCAVTDNCGETLTHGPTIDQTCPTPTLPVAICVGKYTSVINISGQVCA
jgi:hypothetical protein